jgi:protein tyrosine phosphatase (PTP) superfamily phosphohydrolase (DUF442 family)
MKPIISTLFILGLSFSAYASQSLETFSQIKNFKFVSEQLASSGNLELKEYQHIKNYGFKHVINLIPGMQLKEKKHVQSLGMSYQQIPVIWEQPTQENFAKFVALMNSYGSDSVFVHCELNWRASTFVYLYRVTQLGHAKEAAKKDLLAIWTPSEHWQSFIDNTITSYTKK